MRQYQHTKIARLKGVIILLVSALVVVIYTSIGKVGNYQFVVQHNKLLRERVEDLEIQRDSVDFLKHQLQKTNDSLINSKIQKSKTNSLISKVLRDSIVISPVLVVDSIK